MEGWVEGKIGAIGRIRYTILYPGVDFKLALVLMDHFFSLQRTGWPVASLPYEGN